MWTTAVMALSTTAVFGRTDKENHKTVVNPVPCLRLKLDTCQIQARSVSTCSVPPSCDEVFFGMQPAMSTWNAAGIWRGGWEWGELLLSDPHKTSVVYKYNPHRSQMMQIATVCKTVEILSMLYVLELVQQLNSPQTDIHDREFK